MYDHALLRAGPGPERAEPEQTVQPEGKRRITLLIICSGTFLATLDGAIVNLALPVLADEFESSIADVLWVSLTFFVGAVGLALPMGRLGDIMGRRRILSVGWVVYTTGLLIATTAPSLGALLAARAIQAAGAAMIGANGAAVVMATTPVAQRGKALGILAATVGAGQAAGPIIGGLLIDALGWRAVFAVRIPMAVAVFAVVRMLLPADRRSEAQGRVDLVGSVLIVATTASLLLAINRATAETSGGVPLLLATLSVAGAVAFVVVERSVRSPVLDLALFRSRSFSRAVLTAVLHHIGRAGVVVLMPFFLIDAGGRSLVETGLVMVAVPLTLVAVAPLSGALSDRYGPRLLTTIAQGVLVVALLALATVSTSTSTGGVVLRLVLVGVGAGLFGSPNSSAIMNSAPPDRLGTAAASSTTARQIGQAIGVALAGAVFASRVGSSAGGTASMLPADAAAGLEAAMLTAAVIVGCAMVVSGTRPAEHDAEHAAGLVETGDDTKP